MLFASTNHIISSSSSNSVVVTNRVIEVSTYRHVQQRQSSDTPLMAITRNCAKQAVTLKTS